MYISIYNIIYFNILKTKKIFAIFGQIFSNLDAVLNISFFLLIPRELILLKCNNGRCSNKFEISKSMKEKFTHTLQIEVFVSCRLKERREPEKKFRVTPKIHQREYKFGELDGYVQI